MYSKIPMPQVEWNKENMKYALCFFPVIGVIIGGLSWIVGGFLLDGDCGKILFAVIMTLLPVVITGGIHLDGFMDTVDAISAYGDREKRLAILKDSHAGAFSLLYLCCYFLACLGFWSEVSKDMLPVLAGGYVLSRALSGFSVVSFKAARDSGLAKTFQEGANRLSTRIVMIFFILAAVLWIVANSVVIGGTVVLMAGLIFIYYRLMAMKQFGGITGDLAGYFLQLCELAMLIGVVLAGGILWK